MGWFSRKPRTPILVRLPDIRGAHWTFEAEGARRDFASQTTYQSGYRAAFDPPAHAVADLIRLELLPFIEEWLDSPAEDQPFMRQLLTTAAQVGAGIGAIDPHADVSTQELDHNIAGALLLADDNLSTVNEQQRIAVRFLVVAGHYVARFGDPAMSEIVSSWRPEPRA